MITTAAVVAGILAIAVIALSWAVEAAMLRRQRAIGFDRAEPWFQPWHEYQDRRP